MKVDQNGEFGEFGNFTELWSQQEELHEPLVNRLYECKQVKNASVIIPTRLWTLEQPIA